MWSKPSQPSSTRALARTIRCGGSRLFTGRAFRQGASEMHWLQLLSYFFGGAFLANAIPHAVSGMMGRPFQRPFAKPPGQGLSSSTVNVLWGFFNVAVG